MRKLLIVIIVCLGFIGCTKAVKTENKVTDYYPNKEMIKVFSGGFENEGFIHIVNVFEEAKYMIKYFNGITTERIYSIANNQIKLIYSAEVDGEKLIGQKIMNEDINFDKTVLKEPIREGTKWSDNNYSYQITGINKEITTPIGILNTIEVTHSKDDNLFWKTYYAKGIGKVKLEALEGEVVFYNELISTIEYNIDDYKNIESLYELLD